MNHSDFTAPARTWATAQRPALTDASWRNPNFTYIPVEHHTLTDFAQRQRERLAKAQAKA